MTKIKIILNFIVSILLNFYCVNDDSFSHVAFSVSKVIYKCVQLGRIIEKLLKYSLIFG